jgi:uncharacterized Zn finger protein
MSKLIIWLFCEICHCDTEYSFIKDDGIFEVYRCLDCGKIVKYAVR